MTPKKIPVRTCVDCGEKRSKKELVRVVRSPEGEIAIDLKGKMSGRGAYICQNIKCLEAARKSRRIERALSCKIEDSVYEVMMNELGKEA